MPDETMEGESGKKILLPVRIGVDEIATETQKCDGWTYFCLPELYVPEFNTEAQAIIAGSSLHAFHGKKFKVGHNDAYLAFLKIIWKYVKKSLQTLSVNVLMADSTKVSFLEQNSRILHQTLSKAGVDGDEARELLSPYIAPLFTLARVTDKLGPDIVMNVEMDDSNSFESLDQKVHEKYGVSVSGHTLLKGIYNGYAKKKYPKSPQMLDQGLQVMRDSKSILIQAADVLGNFSMAYVFVKIGKRSKSKEAKAKLIEQVWGDEINEIDFSDQVELSGNDLVLKGDSGEINFRIGWVQVNQTKNPTKEQ